MKKTKDPLDELIVETFKAASGWFGDTVTLTFKNPDVAEKFQNEMQKKKGCIIKEG